MAGIMLLAVVFISSPVTAATAGDLMVAGANPTCSVDAAHQFVEGFLNAFNRGDAQQLDRLVAGPEAFVWYSTDSPGQRIKDEAYDRSTLLAYFARRHAQHERLEMRSFRFNGTAPTGLGNFEFELRRSADDGLASVPYGGKGSLYCDRILTTLAVWSMAREPVLRSEVPTLPLIALLVVALAGGGVAGYRWRRKRLGLRSVAP
jgi:hypothetical protein